MDRIKNFKAFLESFSEDLDQVLDNEENNFVITKNDEILVGFEFIQDAFEHVAELIEGDGYVSEEEKFDLTEEIDTSVPSLGEDADQFEIDELLNSLLDKYGVVEPYKILKRSELEETPVDNSIDDEIIYDDDRASDLISGDSKEEIERVLGESYDTHCIVGMYEGEEQEIDSFESEEEANDHIEGYKVIYNEFDELRVVPKVYNESVDLSMDDLFKIKSELIPDAADSMESWMIGYSDRVETGNLSEKDVDLLRQSLAQYDYDLDELIDEINESNSSNCDCNHGNCKCKETGVCNCGDECDCECKKNRDKAVHMRHCNQGDYKDSCKYGENDTCPALNKTNERVVSFKDFK